VTAHSGMHQRGRDILAASSDIYSGTTRFMRSHADVSG